jgi:acyl-CoA thioester hydrolase
MDKFDFSTTIEIRFADLDAYGHVNNAVVFSYLETARVKLFQEHFCNFLSSGLLFLVVRAECDYRKPIELSDQLCVSIRVEKVGRSSFEMLYRLHDQQDKLFADARTVMVCFKQSQGRPVAIPEELRRALQPQSVTGK